MSGDGELVLTFLTSFAQEESRSVSENMKWRVKQNFENGKPWNCTMLGYRNDNGVLVVVPEEAEIVKRIFREYLSGKGRAKIAKELNDNLPRCSDAGICIISCQNCIHYLKNTLSKRQS